MTQYYRASTNDKFQVCEHLCYGQEDPQPGCPRGEKISLIAEFDNLDDAKACLESTPDGDFYYGQIHYPKAWIEQRNEEHRRKLAEDMKNSCDPLHPDYIPF